MNAASLPLKRLLPSTMFGRLAAALVIGVGVMLAVIVIFGWTAQLGAAFYASLVLVAGALIYEHRSAARLDVAAINRAFFTSNAFVGVVFVAAVFVDQVFFR